MKRLLIFALLFVVFAFIPISTGTTVSAQKPQRPSNYYYTSNGKLIQKPQPAIHHTAPQSVVHHSKPQAAIHYPKPQSQVHYPKPQSQVHHSQNNANVASHPKPHYPVHTSPNNHYTAPHHVPQGPTHHSNSPKPQPNTHYSHVNPQIHNSLHSSPGPQIHHLNGPRPNIDNMHNSHDAHGPRPDTYNMHNSHDAHGPRPDIHNMHNSHDAHGPRPDTHHSHDQKSDEHHPKPEDHKPKADNHNPKSDKPKANDSNSASNAGPVSNSGPQTQADNQAPQQDSANGSPCKVPATRQGIVAAAMWAAKSGKYISYSQGGSRWSGITKKTCPYQGVPAVTDCSAFVTWLYWSAFGNGNDFLNGQNWKAGYTGTMGSHGTSVSLAQARPGDVVLYGSSPYHHAVLYVGNNQVVSFGANGPAKLLPINYRSDYHVRSYLP